MLRNSFSILLYLFVVLQSCTTQTQKEEKSEEDSISNKVTKYENIVEQDTTPIKLKEKDDIGFVTYGRTYPFSKTKYIVIYAHPFRLDVRPEVGADIIQLTKSGEVIINSDYKSIIEEEKVILGFTQSKALHDLFLNYDCSESEATVADCFNPRHTLVFFDNSNKAFEKVRICFECDNMDGLIHHFWGDGRQVLEIQKFFKSVGVQYFGTYRNGDYISYFEDKLKSRE